MFKKCPAVATTDHSTSGRWVAAKDLTDCAIQQNTCCDHKRVWEIMCMTRAKYLWLLILQGWGRHSRSHPKCVAARTFPSVFCPWLSYKCWVSKQKHGWNYFLYCCHITSWCQFAHLHGDEWQVQHFVHLALNLLNLLCNIGLNSSLRTYLTVTARLPVAFPPALSGWNVLIQFNSSNLLRLNLSSAASCTACHVLYPLHHMNVHIFRHNTLWQIHPYF